jgi:phosphoglycerate dehydrogenase-like enzyme
VLGLVGIGAIGTETAKRALAFGMEVVAYRRTNTPSPMTEVSVFGDLTEMLSKCDHLVISAPSTRDTFHIIDARALAAVKPGVHMVNVARGTLVDQHALLEAIDDGRVAMATLDVTDPEPLPAGDALYSHPRVRLSPHVSWSSAGSMMRSVELFEENVRRDLAGKPLQGLVDVSEGY